MLLPIHILAGVLALVFGYPALFAAKGGTLHRRSGTFFVYAMVTMSLTGAAIATLTSTTSSIIAGLLTFYFVTTGLLTVKTVEAAGWWNRVAAIYAVGVGLLAFRAGIALSQTGRPETIPMFIFGAMAMLGALGDARMMRAGGIHGPRKIARHLWRMCFAMWVAAASFFWGPPGRVPAIINIPALLPIPVLAPIVVMLYWLWRIRVKKMFQSTVGVRTSAAAARR